MASEDDTLVADSRGTEAPGVSRIGVPLEALARGTAIGRYVALEELGRGAMGVVYLAYDPDLDRRVALKLLQHEGPDANARLLREARAMARLSHPNVVPIHDVGEHEGLVWVAMDLVEGGTLRQWRQAVERDWTEVIGVFQDAGAGLAAAHDAGLVHRDFKPDNVLLTRQGRAMVTDFGLARARTAPDTSAPVLEMVTERADVDATLTATGTLSGTPAYMSPEQFAHKPADPLSDQFSFCIALYEALYGERPFAAQSLPELSHKVLSGSIEAAPSGTSVPAWLRAVVERGLQVDPLARYPSMHALLADLAPRTSRRGRNAALLGGAVLAVGLVAAAIRTHAGPTCDGAATQLQGRWDEARAQRIGEAFAATGIAYAPATFERVRGELDAWAETWSAAHRDSCEATQVRGEQSAARMDQRMACLARQLDEVAAVADELETPDEKLVDRALMAVSHLPDPSACEDPEAAPELSADDREKVDAAQAKLAVAHARNALGRYGPGLEAADTALASLGDVATPLRVEILLTKGQLEHRSGDANTAEATLERALVEHAHTPDPESAAETWLLLLMVVGDTQADSARALPWLLPARLAVEATGSADLKRRYESVAGTVYLEAGKIDQAVEHLQAAVEQARALKVSDEVIDVVLGNYGNALQAAGRYDEARAAYTECLEAAKRAFGESHPAVANAMTNLARAYVAHGEYDEARRMYERALKMRVELLGPEHYNTAVTHLNLGDVLKRVGDKEAARVHSERALEIWSKALDENHPNLAAAHNNLGVLAAEAHDVDKAVEHYGAADEIARRRGGDEALERGGPLNNLGNVLFDSGDYEGALQKYELALRIRRKHVGDDHPLLGYALVGKSRALMKLGRPDEALEAAQWSVRVREAAGLEEPAPLYLAYVTTAEAMVRAGGSRTEAQAWADKAREQYVRTGEDLADAKELASFAEAMAQ